MAPEESSCLINSLPRGRVIQTQSISRCQIFRRCGLECTQRGQRGAGTGAEAANTNCRSIHTFVGAQSSNGAKCQAVHPPCTAQHCSTLVPGEWDAQLMFQTRCKPSLGTTVPSCHPSQSTLSSAPHTLWALWGPAPTEPLWGCSRTTPCLPWGLEHLSPDVGAALAQCNTKWGGLQCFPQIKWFRQQLIHYWGHSSHCWKSHCLYWSPVCPVSLNVLKAALYKTHQQNFWKE